MDQAKIDRVKELSKQMAIDKENLELECVKQPTLYTEICELLITAKEEKDVAKNNVSLVFADLYSKIRKNPEQYGLDKATEKAIESTVIISAEYQQAVNAAISTATVYESLVTLKEAAEQRKSMIRELVALFIHEYYGTKTDLSKSAHQMEKLVEDELEERMFG